MLVVWFNCQQSKYILSLENRYLRFWYFIPIIKVFQFKFLNHLNKSYKHMWNFNHACYQDWLRCQLQCNNLMVPWSYHKNNLMLMHAWYKPSKETPSPQNFLGSGRQLRSTVTHHVPPTTVTLVTFHCTVKHCTASCVNFLCTGNCFDERHLNTTNLQHK